MDESALQSFRIHELPEAGYYVPNFINESHEEYVLQEIAKLPNTRWKTLTRRRLLSLPSQLTGAAGDTLLASDMPPFLTKGILDKMKDLQIFQASPHGEPNHCLVNEYLSGQGIMPHEDGPAYFPVTATISLASSTVLEIYEKNEQGERQPEPRWRILQEPRSLLITTGNMYRDTLHGISEVERDKNLGPDTIVNWQMLGDTNSFEDGSANRETRVSLTYRDVIKVAKIGGALKFMSKK